MSATGAGGDAVNYMQQVDYGGMADSGMDIMGQGFDAMQNIGT